MKGDVMFVVDQILHKLSMEEEEFKGAVKTFNKDICDQKNLLFNKAVEEVSLVTPSEEEKNSNCNLNTSNSFNKNENSVNADTSSGFGDSATLKTLNNDNNDSLTKVESVTYFQIYNETSDIRDPELNDFNEVNLSKTSRIYTSTPKKNKNESKDISPKNSVNSINTNLEKDLIFEKNEFLNRTIEEAINKWEKETEGKKMEDAFVQTSFEKTTSNCCCKIHLPNVKTNEFSGSKDNEEPLAKKAKIEIDSEIPENVDKKTNRTFDSQQSNIKAKMIIPTILKFPGNDEINKCEEKNNCCKIPRIRVGLSKRAKIRPQT